MKAKLYARKCSITGKGMNDGFVIKSFFTYYIAKFSDCSEWLKTNWEMTIKEAYLYSEEEGGDAFYWTAWEDPKDYQYIEIDGELHEISEYFNL